jgi:hypothetical protein
MWIPLRAVIKFIVRIVVDIRFRKGR